MSADGEYLQHEDDDDYGSSASSYYSHSSVSSGSLLETVQEAFMGLGQAIDFSGASAIAANMASRY